MPDGFLFEASYDGIRIDVVNSSIQHGRSVVSHVFPKRDGADLEDMGREPFVCQLSFLFIDHAFVPEGAGDYQQRFEQFNADVVGSSTPRVLVHPYEGAIRCRVSNFTHNASGEGQPVINCQATFTEEISLPPVFAAGAGSQIRASSQDVKAEANRAEGLLDNRGLDTTLVKESITEAETWERDFRLTPREVQLRMAVFNKRLNAELIALAPGTTLELHEINKSYTRLQHAMRRASEAFTSTTTRIITITVTEPLPLRVVAARFYGGTEAESRFAEMRELNPTVLNFAQVPRGTELKAYSPNVESRRLVA